MSASVKFTGFHTKDPIRLARREIVRSVGEFKPLSDTRRLTMWQCS